MNIDFLLEQLKSEWQKNWKLAPPWLVWCLFFLLTTRRARQGRTSSSRIPITYTWDTPVGLRPRYSPVTYIYSSLLSINSLPIGRGETVVTSHDHDDRRDTAENATALSIYAAPVWHVRGTHFIFSQTHTHIYSFMPGKKHLHVFIFTIGNSSILLNWNRKYC